MLRTLTAHEQPAATRDGRWFLVRIMPYRTLENHVEGVAITFTDITSSKRLEGQLRPTQVGLQRHIEAQAQQIEERQEERREINLTASRMLGLERSWLAHCRFALYLDPNDRLPFTDFLGRVFSGAAHVAHEVSLIAGDRGRVVLRLDATLVTNASEEERTITPVRGHDGAILHFVAIGRDLTDTHLLAQQLMRAQRMEMVGRLAGGIAHDFNNLLTVINNTASLAQRDFPSGDPIRHDLREIEQAGKRAAQLTRQLLAFSRKQIMSLERLDLNHLLNGMRGVVRRLFDPNVTIRLSAPHGIGHVRADPAQIEQVILNLVLNASDAMPNGGTLAISVSDRTRDDDFLATHPAVVAGSYVQLTVSDTRVGMSTETAARIFEPFVSTKAVGEGTGLGLAMVYGIVKQSSGYEVLTASNGAEALALLADVDQHVNLMLTDMVMPGMSGWELARQVKELRPGVHCIFTSGYTSDASLPTSTDHAHFISKPYTSGQLTRIVRDVLDGAEPAHGSPRPAND